MASFNKVIMIGNLTADPELKQTPNGISVCRFNIAVNRKRKEGGQAECDFFTVVAWRQSGEFVSKYFTKGKPILVCGQLQTRNWTDQQSVKHYATEIVADEVSFVESKSTERDEATVMVAKAEPQKPQGAPKGDQIYMPTAYSAGAAEFTEVGSEENNLPF